jgi:hypothetical protein
MDRAANRREVHGDLHGGADFFVRGFDQHSVEFRRERGCRRDDEPVRQRER